MPEGAVECQLEDDDEDDGLMLEECIQRLLLFLTESQVQRGKTTLCRLVEV